MIKGCRAGGEEHEGNSLILDAQRKKSNHEKIHGYEKTDGHSLKPQSGRQRSVLIVGSRVRVKAGGKESVKKKTTGKDSWKNERWRKGKGKENMKWMEK